MSVTPGGPCSGWRGGNRPLQGDGVAGPGGCAHARFVQGDITAEDYDEQLLKQSIPYRAILAARNAQIALSHGFTVFEIWRRKARCMPTWT